MTQKNDLIPAGVSDSRRWFWLALVVLLFWLVWKLGPVVMPFALSGALAYLFDPLTDRLEKVRIGKWQWNRTLAVLVVFAIAIGGFVVLLLVVIPMLRTQTVELIARVPRILEWFGSTALPWVQQMLGVQSLDVDPETITENLKELLA